MRSYKTGRKTSTVASAVWHIAPSCWNQMLVISSSSIFVNKTKQNKTKQKKSKNSASKSAPNSDSFRVCRHFNVCVRVFYALNGTILLVYITVKIKMRFIWKEFFFAKIGIFCKSIEAHLAKRCSSIYTTIFVRRKDKTYYPSNQTWAKCYHSRKKH